MAKEADKNITEWQGLKIRTMRKDIAWLQSGGSDIERAEKLKREERQKRMVEWQERKTEEEQRIREEDQGKAEEEREKIEEEKTRIEEERKKFERPETKEQEEIRKWEEESKRIKEQKERMEEEKRQIESLKIEEEKRKQEEERKKREEKILKEKAEIELNKEKIRTQEELQKISEEKTLLEPKKLEFLEKLKPVEKTISIITKRQKVVEDDLEKIEKKEKLTESLEEKREIEKRRWEFEEKRRKIEEERWPWDEEKKKVEKEIQEFDLLFQEILKKETLLKERQKEFSDMEEKTQLENEKKDLKDNLQKIGEDKKILEAEKQKVYKSLVEFNDNLKFALEKERKTEEDITLIKEEQKLVKEEEERRRLEKERREMEEKRREIEKERWKLEEEKNGIELRIEKLEDNYQKILEKGADIIDKIKEIDSRLMPAEKEKEILDKIRERIQEAEKKTAVEETAIEEKPEIKAASLRRASPEETGREESKEFEEVAKEDKSSSPALANARMIEALTKEEPEIKKESEIRQEMERKKRKQERERIMQEQKTTEEEKKKIAEEKRKREIIERIETERKEFLKRVGEEKNKERVEKPFPAKSTSGEPLVIIRPVPEKHSFRERLGMRIAILILLAMVIFAVTLFWYWFLNKRGESPPFPLLPQEETKLPGQEKEKPKIIIPASLIAAEATTVLEVSKSEETSDSLSPVLKSKLPENQFTRVVIKDLGKNKVFSLSDFFDAFQIKAPEGFLDKLDNDFTLFIYSQKAGNRLGFIVKIKEGANLTNSLKTWEKTMEKDTENLFVLMDKQGPALVPYFKDGKYETTVLRIQTFSLSHLGIVYSTTKDYFIFTSSRESMEKIITKLAL